MSTELAVAAALTLQIVTGSWFISKRHPEILHNDSDPACGFGIIVLFLWEFFWLCDMLIGKLHPPEHRT
jgi:hypothetical protein